jgi:hypothetical protein
MSWKDIVKEDYPEIVWTNEKKTMGYVDGRGPYTKESIATELKRVGTYNKRKEFISVRGGQMPTESAWE